MLMASSVPVLTEMANLYGQTGRPADVLQLLDQAPYWGAADLNGLLARDADDEGVSVMWMHTPHPTQSLAEIAANALLATGRQGEALKVTRALLDTQPGLDRGYELLLKLDFNNAIPLLDELFSRDQFEERPLIWKAYLFAWLGGRLEEAGKTARQAIAIDPSDGEEGQGDSHARVRSELADVLETRGNTNEANTMREAVMAIRGSEEADQFYMAGLLKRAIKMLQDSLTHFADAYCIQSRLAIQMSALGMNAEAEEHYRRAYALMPDSFGRVESHCFGCERAFDGERAQSIAEKVFTKIAAERPNKPQVHYLLGYLREEQEEFNGAVSNYLDATRLDPDYLNAWVRLQGVAENVAMPSQQRDSITFNILRLDPLGRHSQPDFRHVADLSGLWNAMQAAAGKRIAAPPPLLTPPARKAAIDKQNADPARRQRFEFQNEADDDSKNLTPGGAVGQTDYVRIAGELLDGQAPGSAANDPRRGIRLKTLS